MNMQRNPAFRGRGVQVVEGALHDHRWMSVNFSGLVAEPAPVRASPPAPRPESPRGRVPDGDMILVGRAGGPPAPVDAAARSAAPEAVFIPVQAAAARLAPARPAGEAAPPPAQARQSFRLTRPQTLLCAVLALVVIGSAAYTAYRWSARQGIVVTEPETRRSAIA